MSDDCSKLPFMGKAHVIPEPAFTPAVQVGAPYLREFERLFPGQACFYCGGDPNSVDHVIPRSRGGDDGRKNLVPCCFRCNQMKSNLTLEEFMAHLNLVLKTLADKPALPTGSKKVIQAGKDILQCPLAA